jgi:hypothetical protein
LLSVSPLSAPGGRDRAFITASSSHS